MSNPIFYPDSKNCRTCLIKCSIVVSAQTKYLDKRYKPRIKCPFEIHNEDIFWEQ